MPHERLWLPRHFFHFWICFDILVAGTNMCRAWGEKNRIPKIYLSSYLSIYIYIIHIYIIYIYYLHIIYFIYIYIIYLYYLYITTPPISFEDHLGSERRSVTPWRTSRCSGHRWPGLSCLPWWPAILPIFGRCIPCWRCLERFCCYVIFLC